MESVLWRSEAEVCFEDGSYRLACLHKMQLEQHVHGTTNARCQMPDSFLWQKSEHYIRFASTALGAPTDHIGKVGTGTGVGWGSGPVRYSFMLGIQFDEMLTTRARLICLL